MALANCLFILGLFSMAIWIYQAIILPSIRQRLRFEMFCLRDRLRDLVIKGELKEESAVFKHLHGRLNTIIKTIPGFDFAMLFNIESDNSDLKERAERFQRLVGGSIPEVQEIYQSALKVMAYALFANSLFWFTWILVATIPVAIPQGIWKLCSIVVEQTKTRILPAFEAQEKELEPALLPALA